jgi:hypothetical protein
MHTLHGYISVERKERLPFVHDILEAMEDKEEWESSSEIEALEALSIDEEDKCSSGEITHPRPLEQKEMTGCKRR